MTSPPYSVDLRSDTLTLPSPGMRKAMYEARLGDDVYGEDPTVNDLQDYAAALSTKKLLYSRQAAPSRICWRFLPTVIEETNIWWVIMPTPSATKAAEPPY